MTLMGLSHKERHSMQLFTHPLLSQMIDRDAVNNHLVSVCVRVFLEKRETLLSRFCEEFKMLSLIDEKQDLVENFLGTIHAEMENDSIWQGIRSCKFLFKEMFVLLL